jgi:excisionase family DNA binding protein
MVRAPLVDEEGIYDPRSINDRLLLGMKGTMSEMEVSVFRQRSIEARKQKARRGELFMTVAVGYLRTDRVGIEKDPDRRVQEAIALVFAKFAEFQTARQVLVWMRQERITLPVLVHATGQRSIEWKMPVYHTVHHILTNPIYAGAYVFGRRKVQVRIEDGRKRVARSLARSPAEWEVFLKDHHEGYITWTEFERNQRLLSDNINGQNYVGRGSVRRGAALLTGLCRCARCGRRLTVSYGGIKVNSPRYGCPGAFSERAEMSCISFGSMRIDQAVAQEILDRVQPLGIEAALTAMKDLDGERSEKRTQMENALEQARFEAARARRQYDSADPENRLVAAELERRWNDKLLALRALEDEMARIDAAPGPHLSSADRERLLMLGSDLTRAWDSPGVSAETRKKIVRLLISEIIVDVVDNTIVAIIHWEGGDHTRLEVRKNRVGETRWVTDADTVDLVRVLARQMPDATIAAILNRSAKSTGRGLGWTRVRVCSLRHHHDIPVYREGERSDRGEMTVAEAATALRISRSTIWRMVNSGILPAQQFCRGAPWIVRCADLINPNVQREADSRRCRRPVSEEPLQEHLNL